MLGGNDRGARPRTEAQNTNRDDYVVQC